MKKTSEPIQWEVRKHPSRSTRPKFFQFKMRAPVSALCKRRNQYYCPLYHQSLQLHLWSLGNAQGNVIEASPNSHIMECYACLPCLILFWSRYESLSWYESEDSPVFVLGCAMTLIHKLHRSTTDWCMELITSWASSIFFP